MESSGGRNRNLSVMMSLDNFAYWSSVLYFKELYTLSLVLQYFVNVVNDERKKKHIDFSILYNLSPRSAQVII